MRFRRATTKLGIQVDECRARAESLELSAGYFPDCWSDGSRYSGFGIAVEA